MKKSNLWMPIKPVNIMLIISLIALAGCQSGLVDTSDLTVESDQVVIHFFWGDGCPYCTRQKEFLDEFSLRYPDVIIRDYETYSNPQNARLMQALGRAYGVPARGVPMTFIGDFTPLVGFDASVGRLIEQRVNACIENGCIDPLSKIQ